MKLTNLSGNKFNRLLVISKYDKQSGHTTYLCKCDCNNEVVVKGIHLTSGHTKSCGCYMKEKTTKRNLSKGKNFNKQFYYYKRNAKRRDIEFNLDLIEFERIRNNSCAYCGQDGPNGIDRINNNEGYILTNCAPCCTICNKAKDTMTVEQFKTWIKRVYKEIVNGD